LATTMTLAQLRTAIRQRADMVNSTFISDAELNSYINQSYFELYDLLVQKYGDNYYVATPVQFDCDGSSQQYALPNGTNFSGAPAFYKLLGVDLQLANQNDSFVTIRPFNFSDRNRYAVPKLPKLLRSNEPSISFEWQQSLVNTNSSCQSDNSSLRMFRD